MHQSTSSVALRRTAISNQRKNSTKSGLTEGLDGIFRGLGDLLQRAVEMAETTQEAAETHRGGSVGGDGLRAVYGVSVRVGPGNMRTIENFGNLRQRPGQKPVIDEFREPMTDLLDEGDHLVIVAELPGIAESDIEWKIAGKAVVITACAGDRKYLKKVPLPVPINENSGTSSYKNGILELKLWKQQAP